MSFSKSEANGRPAAISRGYLFPLAPFPAVAETNSRLHPAGSAQPTGLVSAPRSQRTPIKSGAGCGHMRLAPSRQSALGQALVRNVFTAIVPKAGTETDLVDHFSAAWCPLDKRRVQATQN